MSAREILLEPAHDRWDAKGGGAFSAGHRLRSWLRAGIRGTRRRASDAWHLPRSDTKRLVSVLGAGKDNVRDTRGSSMVIDVFTLKTT